MVIPFCSRADIGFAAQCTELVRAKRPSKQRRKKVHISIAVELHQARLHKHKKTKSDKSKDPDARRRKAEAAALDQLKKKWKTFPKLKLQYAQTEAFSGVRGWVYQTQGEE